MCYTPLILLLFIYKIKLFIKIIELLFAIEQYILATKKNKNKGSITWGDPLWASRPVGYLNIRSDKRWNLTL